MSSKKFHVSPGSHDDAFLVVGRFYGQRPCAKKAPRPIPPRGFSFLSGVLHPTFSYFVVFRLGCSVIPSEVEGSLFALVRQRLRRPTAYRAAAATSFSIGAPTKFPHSVHDPS